MFEQIDPDLAKHYYEAKQKAFDDAVIDVIRRKLTFDTSEQEVINIRTGVHRFYKTIFVKCGGKLITTLHLD